VKAFVAILLIALEPLHFSGELIAVIPTITYRGWCVMAGFALLNDSPDGRRIATVAIVASFLRVVQSTYWSALPDNTIPGDELFRVGIAGAAALIAIVILRRR
jgi:hypothetical protein